MTTSSINQFSAPETLDTIASLLRMYLLPFIVIIGSVLNLLSFFVMRRIRSTTSFYMAILGLTDTGVLLTGGLNLWLYQANHNWSLLLVSRFSCKFLTFMFYTMIDLSVAIIVIMTGERYFAVSRPLHVNQFFNRKKTFIIMFAACFLCCFINSHLLFTHTLVSEDDFDESDPIDDLLKHSMIPNENGNDTFEKFIIDTKLLTAIELVNETLTDNSLSTMPTIISLKQELKYTNMKCSYHIWSTFYDTYWIFIDATIYSFLPFIFLCIFNISIIRYLIKAAKDSSKLKRHQKPLIGTFVSFQAKKSNNNSDNSNPKSFDSIHLYETNHSNTAKKTLSEDKLVKTSHTDKHNKSKRATTNDNSTTHNNNNNNNNSQSKQSNIQEDQNSFNQTPKQIKKFRPPQKSYIGINKRLTFMLFLINVTFCMLSMPVVIIQIIHHLKYINSAKTTNNNLLNTSSNATTKEVDINSEMNLLIAISQILQYLNHSTNFFLYSLSGRTFRNETKSCLSCYAKKIKNVFRH